MASSGYALTGPTQVLGYITSVKMPPQSPGILEDSAVLSGDWSEATQFSDCSSNWEKSGESFSLSLMRAGMVVQPKQENDT